MKSRSSVCAGTASGRPARAIQVGGPLGTYLPDSQWDVALYHEAWAEIGGMLGHGGIEVFHDTVDMAQQVRFAMEFCSVESCGKSTPYRNCSVRGVEVIDRIVAGDARDFNLALLDDLFDTLSEGSLCATGGLTHYPVLSALHKQINRCKNE